MSNDAGLPLPTAPYLFPSRPPAAPIPSTPDVPSVSGALSYISSQGASMSSRWSPELAANLAQLGNLSSIANVPAGAFTEQPTTLDQIGQALAPTVPGQPAMGLGQRAWQLFTGAMSYLNDPARTSATDTWNQVINDHLQELRDTFGQTNGPWLQMEKLGFAAQQDISDLSDTTLGGRPTSDPTIDDLWQQKQTVGDDVLADLAAALRDSEPGDDRDRLQAMWLDMSAWQQSRDQRLDRERGDIRALQDKVSQIQDVALTQTGVFNQLQWAASVMLPSDPVRLCDPNVAAAAIGMRASLMQMKAVMDAAVSPTAP